MKLEAKPVSPDDATLDLALRGADGEVREYSIQPCDGETLLVLMTVEMGGRTPDGMATIAAWATGRSEREQWEAVLGEDVAAAMIADGVSGPDLMRAVKTARYWHIMGDEAARWAWDGEEGKAPSTG